MYIPFPQRDGGLPSRRPGAGRVVHRGRGILAIQSVGRAPRPGGTRGGGERLVAVVRLDRVDYWVGTGDLGRRLCLVRKERGPDAAAAKAASCRERRLVLLVVVVMVVERPGRRGPRRRVVEPERNRRVGKGEPGAFVVDGGRVRRSRVGGRDHYGRGAGSGGVAAGGIGRRIRVGAAGRARSSSPAPTLAAQRTRGKGAAKAAGEPKVAGWARGVVWQARPLRSHVGQDGRALFGHLLDVVVY